MAGKYEIKKTTDGKYAFNLKAGNGEIILSSQRYESKAAALNGIESCRKNLLVEDRFERREAKDGQHYFVVKAGNHEVIGRSELYRSKSGMENGISSCMRNADSPVVDLT